MLYAGEEKRYRFDQRDPVRSLFKPIRAAFVQSRPGNLQISATAPGRVRADARPRRRPPKAENGARARPSACPAAPQLHRTTRVAIATRVHALDTRSGRDACCEIDTVTRRRMGTVPMDCHVDCVFEDFLTAPVLNPVGSNRAEIEIKDVPRTRVARTMAEKARAAGRAAPRPSLVHRWPKAPRQIKREKYVVKMRQVMTRPSRHSRAWAVIDSGRSPTRYAVYALRPLRATRSTH
ncbi:hypothetical protein EVAR_98104_1 [Eumeta japonica]|uniref:Uncharacterized protein n=1 Tax=Eumeta variegata TaxID=151549 RepID=A0A4C1XGU3_EUMVA|nr:hypothetical protein EVAR_98104_1 [Eumeta japonica]